MELSETNHHYCEQLAVAFVAAQGDARRRESFVQPPGLVVGDY